MRGQVTFMVTHIATPHLPIMHDVYTSVPMVTLARTYEEKNKSTFVKGGMYTSDFDTRLTFT